MSILFLIIALFLFWFAATVAVMAIKVAITVLAVFFTAVFCIKLFF